MKKIHVIFKIFKGFFEIFWGAIRKKLWGGGRGGVFGYLGFGCKTRIFMWVLGVVAGFFMWILETDPKFSLGFGSGPRSNEGNHPQKHIPGPASDAI